jgi:hypothetical protein
MASLVPKRIRKIKSKLAQARMIERLSEAEKANTELKVQIIDQKKNMDILIEKNPFGSEKIRYYRLSRFTEEAAAIG